MDTYARCYMKARAASTRGAERGSFVARTANAYLAGIIIRRVQVANDNGGSAWRQRAT